MKLLGCTHLKGHGRLMSHHPFHQIDKQTAAKALIYGLTVVTRNVDNFYETGVGILNPLSSVG
jgi:predicted nucleic acid-binding protein